jgi:hypothetical protein
LRFGRPWRVRFGRRRRPRSSEGWNGWAALDLLDPDAWPLVALILALVLVGLMIFFVLPIAVFLIELVLFLGIALVAAAVRVLLHRPWVVEADTSGPPAQAMHWRVAGWAASGRAINEVAEALDLGHRAIQPSDAEPEPP